MPLEARREAIIARAYDMTVLLAEALLPPNLTPDERALTLETFRPMLHT